MFLINSGKSISKSWLKIGAGAEAANKAAAGHFVLTGLKSIDHKATATNR